MKIEISPDTLRRLYIKESLTTYQIAEKFGSCQATIWKRLHQYKIRPRLPWKLVKFSEKELRKLYIDKKLSTWEIQKRFGYVRGTVYRKLKEYGIPTRNIALSHITHERSNFEGNLTEKAYIIGFSWGDLNVTKSGPKSETIIVKCGTTKIAQIALFKKVFGQYGKIWVGKPTKTGRINAQVSLNTSFSFLLKKRKIIDQWILLNKKSFLAFLAGFSDAEGSFFISKGQGIFSIGNYNKKVLIQIKNKLRILGIETPPIHTHQRKGLENSNGYIWNGNYSIFHCSRKKHLTKLISLITPYIKHRDKLLASKKVSDNISRRNQVYGNLRIA